MLKGPATSLVSVTELSISVKLLCLSLHLRNKHSLLYHVLTWILGIYEVLNCIWIYELQTGKNVTKLVQRHPCSVQQADCIVSNPTKCKINNKHSFVTYDLSYTSRTVKSLLINL